MKDFNRAFGTMLNVGVSAPLCIGIAGPALLNTTSPSFVINGGINAGINAGSQYVATGKIDKMDVGASFFFHKANLMNLAGYSFTAGFFDYTDPSESLKSPFLGNKEWSKSIMETGVNGMWGYKSLKFGGFVKNRFAKNAFNFGFGTIGNYNNDLSNPWGN